MSHLQFHGTSAHTNLLDKHMTTGRINQVTIPQGTQLGTLLHLPLLKGGWPFTHNLLTGNPLGHGRRARHSTPSEGNLFSLCLIFPLLHPCKLQAYSETDKPRNTEKLPWGRMILTKLCLYSWPKAIWYNIHPFSRCPPQTTCLQSHSFHVMPLAEQV